jgi:PAS domain S-box-containing protein
MTGIRFNIRQRRYKNNKNKDNMAHDADRASLPSRGPAGVASPSAALVACIPCPALVIDGDRKISALNDPLCDAFGVRAGFYHIGEDFADFARRMSLSGNPGLLGLGDLLNKDSVHRYTEIVARNGTVYDARACQTADDGTLITLVHTPARGDSNLDKIARNIVENLPGAVMSLVRHPDGRLQCGYASPLSPELFGREMDELTSPRTDFRDLIADEHRSTFDDAIRCGTDTTAPINIEIRVKNTTRGLLLVRCFGAASPGDDGTVVCDIRMRDIEDRQRVAEDRRRLQDLLNLVMDNIPFMINVKDARDRTFVMVNRVFEEATGLSRSEILGHKDCRPLSKSDRKSREACYEQLLESGCPLDFPEFTVETPDKGQRLLKPKKYPLVDEAGEVNYILSITEDITERKNSENALRRSEQRLREAIESLADGVALFDSDYTLVMCNTRYWTMWPGHEKTAVPGASLETLVRSYLETAISHGAKLDIDSELKTTLERHGLFRSSRDMRVFDGRWFQVSNHPTADGGFAITCTDITALKEREESLRKASRLAISAKETAEGANRSKSDFLANMSHELRTPLNAVIGFSEIIKGALLGDSSIDPYRGYAQDIHDSGRHLLSLINDILDMSKIEAGKLDLFEEHIDLADAIEASLRLVKERAHRNKISLSTDIPDDLPKLNGDLRKLKQIAINLLSNAVKFTREGGSITTRLFIGDTGELYLRITDTGIGISKEDLEKVLEPFGQAEAGLSRQYEGTGLGLTLTQALTELHGGRLEIESETEGPTRGTTVTAIFPKGRVVT